MATAAYELARKLRLLADAGGWTPGRIVERAVAGPPWADFVRNLGNEDRLSATAWQLSVATTAALPWVMQPSLRRRPLGVIWNPNPWGALRFCDDCTEFWHDLVDDPKASATALLSMTAISRRRRSRANSLRRA